jgi:hypothetical protein
LSHLHSTNIVGWTQGRVDSNSTKSKISLLNNNKLCFLNSAWITNLDRILNWFGSFSLKNRFEIFELKFGFEKPSYKNLENHWSEKDDSA